MAFSYEVCPSSERQPQLGLMEAPGQQSILPGAPGCSNILGVLSRAWLGRTGSGQGASMGQGNLPRARAPSPPPVMSNPVSPVGSQGLCATLAPALPPPPLSPCKAGHWDGQSAPVAPGQDALAQAGGRGQHLPEGGPRSPGCSTFCGLRGARDVSEQQSKGPVSPCKHRWVRNRHSPAPGMSRGRLGVPWQRQLRRKLFASLCWMVERSCFTPVPRLKGSWATPVPE